MALLAEQARHTENVFHIALRACETLWSAKEIASAFKDVVSCSGPFCKLISRFFYNKI